MSSSQCDCSFCGEFSGNSDTALWPPKGRSITKGRLIIDSETFVVFPSLGPIMSGHLLVVPRRHVQSMAALSPSEKDSLVTVTAAVNDRLSNCYGSPVILFEHGAPEGSATGPCTVGHAHWHLVPTSLAPEELMASDETWHPLAEPFPNPSGEYLLLGRPGGPYWSMRSQTKIASQLLRQRLAYLLSKPHRADWRQDHGVAEVLEAVAALGLP